MLLALWIGAIATGLLGIVQGLKYAQTPNKTHLTLGLVFLLVSGCFVYFAMTTSS
jgi:hypothetical protein